eukprot:1477540-Rhodomonas_salina.1
MMGNVPHKLEDKLGALTASKMLSLPSPPHGKAPTTTRAPSCGQPAELSCPASSHTSLLWHPLVHNTLHWSQLPVRLSGPHIFFVERIQTESVEAYASAEHQALSQVG